MKTTPKLSNSSMTCRKCLTLLATRSNAATSTTENFFRRASAMSASSPDASLFSLRLRSLYTPARFPSHAAPPIRGDRTTEIRRADRRLRHERKWQQFSFAQFSFGWSACLAKSIRSHETNGQFGSEQVQIRPDLILQQLPKIEITQVAKSSCEHANEQRRREPLCWNGGSHSPPLLCDEFQDGESNPQSQ